MKLCCLALVFATLALAQPVDVAAQASLEREQFRIGLTFGSTSLVGVRVEYFLATRTGLNVTLGTWSGRDISATASIKQYLGGGDARAFVGLGLWDVLAWQEEGRGNALILRVPIGLEYEAFNRTALGLGISVSRALVIDRADPEDERGATSRIVPLPGFHLMRSLR